MPSPLRIEELLANYLYKIEQLSATSYKRLSHYYQNQKTSLHVELRFLLYLGVTLFTTGMGMVIYENINQIGHLLLIIFLFTACAAAYWYAFKKSQPFTRTLIQHPDTVYDYIVLLAASLVVCAQSYLVYHFQLGQSYITWLAFVSSIILFATAFRFDHKGVLGIAITLHGTFFGLAVTPTALLLNFKGDASNNLPLFTFLFFGLLLYGYGLICKRYNLKPHFNMLFTQFGLNISLLSMLIGVFNNGLLYTPILAGVCTLTFYEARKQYSFALLLSTIIAIYIASTYLFASNFFRRLSGDDVSMLLFGLIVLGLLSTGVVVVLINHKKLLQPNGK